MELSISEYMANGIKEAEIRRNARIEEIGEEEYARIVKEDYDKRMMDELRQDFIKAIKKRLGKKLQDCTFENFTESYDPARGYDNRKAYAAALHFAHFPKKGLLLSSNPGTGKNHLVAAICNELAVKMKRCYVSSAEKLRMKLYEAFMREDDAIESILDYDVVCINDLGQERHTDTATAQITEFIDRAYEMEKPLVITTNLDSGELEERYGTRTVSRLHEMCTLVKFKDFDHRLKKC